MFYFVRWHLIPCALSVLILSNGTARADELGHPGPLISAYIERGETRLPLYQVAHLHKNDKLIVNTGKSGADGKWLLVLAAISPTGNKVDAHEFDLSTQADVLSIDIAADDVIPVMVLAPQVRTLFGINTSFDQSASLIADAISADPQRFVELQKIDQINQAITALGTGLDAAVQSQKPGHAVDSAKALAAKFGVKNVDAACFKDGAVDTKCVASNIVSSKDLVFPAVSDLGALAEPFAAAKLSSDMVADVRLFSAASTFLANKYRDQYDFAPSSAQRKDDTEQIQLYSNARYQSGNVKTAYIYVPSWYAGKQPVLSVPAASATCLSIGHLDVAIDNNLPLGNYWHDWKISLRQPGTSTVVLRSSALAFKPEKGLFEFDFKQAGKALPLEGQQLEATIEGRFGFSHVLTAPFKVVLPVATQLIDHLEGRDLLVAGELAHLRFANAGGNCVEGMQIKGIASAPQAKDRHDELSLDLRSAPPGAASIEIRQYGVAPQVLPLSIKQRMAHVRSLVHYDMDNEIIAGGDNLERIAYLQAGAVRCTPSALVALQAPLTTRAFTCAPATIKNEQLDGRIGVHHVDDEPAAFDSDLTKLGARPHVQVDAAHGPVRILLSPKAVQWGLTAGGPLISEDSALSLLLRGFGNYQLARGSYTLEIKFDDDLATEQAPLRFPLLVDRAHNELRTKVPLTFQHVPLPGVVNALWYRVQHQPSGYVGDWQALKRSVITLPALDALSCEADGQRVLIHGKQLDQIDWLSADLTRTSAPSPPAAGDDTVLTLCGKEQCVGVERLGEERRLRIKLHWIDDRLFDVDLRKMPACMPQQR